MIGGLGRVTYLVKAELIVVKLEIIFFARIASVFSQPFLNDHQGWLTILHTHCQGQCQGQCQRRYPVEIL